MTLITRFVRFNKSVSRTIRPYLPQAKTNLHEEYARVVAAYMSFNPGMTVADIGAGKNSHFAKHLDRSAKSRIIAIDVSDDELAENDTAAEKRVADVTRHLPLAHGEADIIVSHSVLEHLEDVESFIQKAAGVLLPGGHFISVFPSKYALYALLNRMLPRELSSRLLRLLVPGSEGVLGFPTYYDNCFPSAMTRVLRRNGFEVVDVRVSYAQTDYFAFLLPLYLLIAAFEMLLMALGWRNLAATVMIVARRVQT